MMRRWLLKTEPEEYSFADLLNEGVTVWDGVKAPAALKNMRSMQVNDAVLIYHSGKVKAVVGTARVSAEAYPDPDREDKKLIVVKIAAGEALKNRVALSVIKDSGLFADWELVRMPRLSVMPVSDDQWNKIIEWSL
jgi:predicted RNA-binding protein with PUA-like domain